MRLIKFIMLCAVSALVISCKTENGVLAKEEIFMLVGSYADESDEGITLYRLNEETGEATYHAGMSGIADPSFLTVSKQRDMVYAVSESEHPMAVSLQFEKTTGSLTPLNNVETGGGSPCHINLSPNEKFATVANYMGGSISIFPIAEDGTLKADRQLIQFAGSGTHPSRQQQPHLHSTYYTPDGKFLLANDLGKDNIYMYRADEKQATLIDEHSLQEITVKAGTGPRHITFSKDGKFVYLIGELSGKVAVLSYKNETLTPIQYIAADSVGAEGSADIHLSPDGKFLYASNRLQADGLAIFRVDQKTGMLEKIGYQPTGIHPRNFGITPNGKYLLVACRDDNAIEIYRRDTKTGMLCQTNKIETKQPVCIQFVQN